MTKTQTKTPKKDHRLNFVLTIEQRHQIEQIRQYRQNKTAGDLLRQLINDEVMRLGL